MRIDLPSPPTPINIYENLAVEVVGSGTFCAEISEDSTVDLGVFAGFTSGFSRKFAHIS